jgi:3-dehydroquinate synthetase
VDLVQIPSTWLSAIDSAHGGKTALNIGGVKNQIGTFHPAKEIHLARPLLFSQGQERARDAFGELAKIAIIAMIAARITVAPNPTIKEKKIRRKIETTKPNFLLPK